VGREFLQSQRDTGRFLENTDSIGSSVSNSIPVDADLGYLGIKEYHPNSFIPVKSSKKHQQPAFAENGIDLWPYKL
jgi:hypothetical protein